MLHLIALIVCALATAVLGWRSVLAFKGRQVVRGARLLGWALVPLGAWLAGLVTLVSRIASAVGRWTVSLVFNPITWSGVVILVVAVALLVATGFRARRTPTTDSSADMNAHLGSA